MYFFSSDLHLGDGDTIKREARPFASVEEFEEQFVANVNQVACEDDLLYILGDWFNCYNHTRQMPPSDPVAIIKRLKPKVVLIMGNGEERMVRNIFGSFEAFRNYCLEAGFLDVLPDCELTFGGRQFYLNHFPRNHRDGFINLFGHTHRGTGLWKPYGLNVGIDLNHFRPFSENDIMELVDTKENWWDIDPDCLSM